MYFLSLPILCRYIKTAPFDRRIAHIPVLYVAVYPRLTPAPSPHRSALTQTILMLLSLRTKPNAFLIFHDPCVLTLLLIGKCTNKQAINVPITMVLPSVVDRDSLVELGGLAIESRWGRDFPPVQTGPWGPHSLLYNGHSASFPRVKRPGRGVDHPLQRSSEVEERVELYLYPPP